MGNSKSKIKSREKTYGKVGVSSQAESTRSSVANRGEPDPQLLLLKRTIERNPEMFILNNLMMCVQFFGNYDEEIKLVKETLASKRESELNKHLPRQKHVLMPDILQEQIARNVRFVSMRKTGRPTLEPLLPIRIYVVHNNIDITEHDDPPQYSNVNDFPMYNVLLKPTQHCGYVQLQVLDEFPSKKSDDVDLSSIAETEDELYSEAESIYGPKPRSIASANMVRPAVPMRESFKDSKFNHSKSLPNLCDEDVVSEDPIKLSHFNRNVKNVTDYDNGSLAEERGRSNVKAGSKGELFTRESPQWEKQVPRTKIVQRSTNHDQISNNSSGYRSGNYGMDTDSNPSQTSKASPKSGSTETDILRMMNGEYPNSCFKKITYAPDGTVYNPKKEKIKLLNSKQRRLKKAMRRHNYQLTYVNSKQFTDHFKYLFEKRLAYLLGFDKESVNNVEKSADCVVYCDKIMVSNEVRYSHMEQYEVIPAVWLDWPMCAQEWLDRPRSTWPDYTDVDRIKDFGCYVVPESFELTHEHSNLMEDLEWQLTFPATERYLETCMTQAQVQVYLITLMLHKTFLRPVFDTIFGLTTSHIRHKLFWMIEEDDRPSKWPYNGMGECLLKLLNSLYSNIGQNEPTLQDYFVNGRNLFKNIPGEDMLYTQKQLKRITENPVMYVFHAMENIYYNENFFPRLNYEMLFKILTMDTLSLLNPTLSQNIPMPMTRKQPEAIVQEDKYGTVGFWDRVKTTKNQRSRQVAQPIVNKTLINTRKASDSIIEISIRCASLEGPRLYILLEFFIRHFIVIAERCGHYKAGQQKTSFLNHADRLSILLLENQNFKENALAFRNKIRDLRRKKLGSDESQEKRPPMPKRNQETAIYASALNDRFTRESPNKVRSSMESRASASHGVTNVTKAIVHESPYEEPDEQPPSVPVDKSAPTASTSQSSTEESVVSESNNGKRRLTVKLLDSSEAHETTYI
ncbi:uncharacterized protein LOC143429690 [Xylocopa sonorina]|uniref:uncharacterized protein LOC143429690 n=1 Tax=Xylocopa sonorina TaxID=1818115 RepID=UPI00403AFD09